MSDSITVLPPVLKSKLHNLFTDVEKEFEALYLENIQLRERVSVLERGGTHYETDEKDRTLMDEHDSTAALLAAADRNVLKSLTKHKNVVKTRYKLKAHTSKIVSSFKTPSLTSCLAKEYLGHKDGLWDISISRLGHPLIGTASADKTARIWGVDSGRCLTLYTGHTGSVNGIAFHPSQDLVLTVSGDGTGHIWQASPVLPDSTVLPAASQASSDDSPDSGSEDDYGNPSYRSGYLSSDRQQSNNNGGGGGGGSQFSTVRTPISTLVGHQGVVISCQWLNESMAVTAGWDRQANLYNIESGVLVQSLVGHDSELTHVACHPTQRLVATCSTDSTFRLWDFRENIHSVSVFQGHTESVTCAVFSRTDQIVSGSDDRCVKVWDLRNMRAPLTNIQTQSAVNRLDVSASGLIAIPQDNRQVVIYDLNGQKLSRLPRDAAKSHHRMVSAVCWSTSDVASDAWRSKANLFSAGFDRKAFGWSVRLPASASATKDEAAAGGVGVVGGGGGGAGGGVGGGGGKGAKEKVGKVDQGGTM